MTAPACDDARMAQVMRRAAVEAGALALAVARGSDLGLATKIDDSPVTRADMLAEARIAEILRGAFPDVAVVSEEDPSSHDTGSGEDPADLYFLVDPLDGTREFIAGSAEYTINIALIADGRPCAGVVYAPALGRLFQSGCGLGAVEERDAQDPERPSPRKPLAVTDFDPSKPRILVSRSHLDDRTRSYLALYPGATVHAVGSSLKLCLIAAGEADLYPRFGPTMEWDTAAGQAILEAAGGRVVRLEDGAPLRCGRSDRRNPAFLAAGRNILPC